MSRSSTSTHRGLALLACLVVFAIAGVFCWQSIRDLRKQLRTTEAALTAARQQMGAVSNTVTEQLRTFEAEADRLRKENERLEQENHSLRQRLEQRKENLEYLYR